MTVKLLAAFASLVNTTTPLTLLPYLKCSSCFSSTYIFNLYKENKIISTCKLLPISTGIQISTPGPLRRLIPGDSKKKKKLVKKNSFYETFIES